MPLTRKSKSSTVDGCYEKGVANDLSSAIIVIFVVSQKKLGKYDPPHASTEIILFNEWFRGLRDRHPTRSYSGRFSCRAIPSTLSLVDQIRASMVAPDGEKVINFRTVACRDEKRFSGGVLARDLITRLPYVVSSGPEP